MDWTGDFFLRRGIDGPDGRSLFQYRLVEDEYKALTQFLCNQDPSRKLDLSISSAFVLFASEWWRRNYNGGSWAWRSITDPLGWQVLDHPILAQMVRKGLRFWNRPLLTYESAGTGYLLSIILEGGLPVNILETSGNNLTRYLKALLNEFATYRGSGIPIEKLAADLGRFLPQGFRRAGVYKLSADLIASIDELSSNLDLKQDPFKQLELQNPHWQNELPFVLESENARHMINGLLKQAKRSRLGDRGQFRLRRVLTHVGEHWKHSATLVIPTSISVEAVSKKTGLSESLLPSRAELIIEGGSQLRKGAQFVRSGDEYNVYSYDKSNLTLSVLPFEQVNCSFSSGSNYLGDFPIGGGEAVNVELPLIFSIVEGRDDELELIGQGGMATKRGSVVIALPETSAVESYEGRWEKYSDDTGIAALYTLEGEVKVTLSDGLFCVIKTHQDHESSNPLQCK